MLIDREVNGVNIRGIMRLKNMALLAILFCAISLQGEVSLVKSPSALTVCTEYGDYTVQEPVLIELIESPAMERLKHIRQYGVSCYARHKPDFSRYDHSLGVFVLLRRFGASLEEQIAGLLHDASHTVYSHVGDFVFSHYFDRYSYQDDIHEWFLDKVGVTAILKNHGLEHCCSEHAKKSMRMLEQDKPDLCMDRIEYLLRGGLCDNLLTEQEVHTILNDLYFENGLWTCKTLESARTIGMTSLWLSEHVFGSAWNSYTYTHAANALKRALEIKILSLDDIHFSTDDVVWQKLKSQNDTIINTSIDKIERYEHYFTLGDENNHTIHYKAKFLGVNPWVETDNGIARLTELDARYAAEYTRIDAIIKRGWYLVEQN